MTLDILGWKNYCERYPEHAGLSQEEVARVAVENRGSYLLYSVYGEIQGILRGKDLSGPGSAFPKVGDWVAIQKLPGEQKAVIDSILERKTKISRFSSGKEKTEQLIAANVDIIFIIQSLDADFSLPRLERYLVAAQESGCQPVIILNKSDLPENPEEKLLEVKQAAPQALAFLVSAKTGANIGLLKQFIRPGTTIAFVGSSGVGKSSIINALAGSEIQNTQEVRLSDSKGRHTTTKRELLLLPDGALLIDTPGMREFGLWASSQAIGGVFSEMEELAAQCRYNDCDHIKSQGCALLEAVQEGRIPEKRYQNYLKLQREASFNRSKEDVKVRLERKNKWKKISKEIKKISRRKY